MIIDVPESLKNNNYFSQPENISCAILSKDNNDTLYFISKKITGDSNTYVLVLTPNFKITGYDYLNFTKTSNGTLFASSSINLPKDKIHALYFLPMENIIFSKISKRIKYTVPVVSEPYKPKSENAPFLELGFRYENFLITSDISSSTASPININFCVGISFLKYFKIDIEGGGMIVSADFEGFDEGVFLKITLFNTHIRGIIGIDFFSNIGQLPHGVSFSGNRAFTFFCVGIGCSISKNFNVEGIYYIPQSKIIYDDPFDPHGTIQEQEINNGLIGLGFQYSFIF